ncbi:MAG TPA: response regulator [Acidimicrobiales bacterium]|nr:response regulator [Acidimicrobiales bacterium]
MQSGGTVQSRRPLAPARSDGTLSARLRPQHEPTGGPGSPPAVDVLVVDDEDSVRSSICEILDTAGLTTGEASDGEHALQELSHRRVGAMVVDVRMPRLDGITMLQRLSHPPPTILVSAYVIDDEDRERLSGKVLAYLQKPFRPQELLRLVSDALGR